MNPADERALQMLLETAKRVLSSKRKCHSLLQVMEISEQDLGPLASNLEKLRDKLHEAFNLATIVQEDLVNWLGQHTDEGFLPDSWRP